MEIKITYLMLIFTLLFGCKEKNTTEPKDKEPLLSNITAIDDSTKIEIVTWNIERFPKTDLSDEYLGNIIKGLGADIYLLQEIQSKSILAAVVGGLEEYDYFLQTNSTGLSLTIVYKNDIINLLSTEEILESDIQYFASRPPLLTKIEWQKGGLSKNLSLINIHYKCCGDDSIDIGNYDDEEFRRVKANESLYYYINDNLSEQNVIIAGDWNDAIQEPKNTNVFQIFIDDSTNYKFVDMDIAKGRQEDWSWQGWESSYPAIHFDHILINKNLFDEFENNSLVKTIKIEEYFENGISDYDKYVSDHRPVYFKFTP